MKRGLLTQAAEKYKVVTQIGRSGAFVRRNENIKRMDEAGILGETLKRSIAGRQTSMAAGNSMARCPPFSPTELKWDLWLGTAAGETTVDDLVPPS